MTGGKGRYEWAVQVAKKNRRGRAKGGVIMGIRVEMLEKGAKIETKEEGLVVGSDERKGKMEDSGGIHRNT